MLIINEPLTLIRLSSFLSFACLLVSVSIITNDALPLRPTILRNKNDNRQHFDSLKAVDFMRKFGYLDKKEMNDVEELYLEEAIKDVLREVQQYGGIPQTGILDNRTIELMNSPRCGVPEIRNVTSNRAKRFLWSGQRWEKRVITYKIISYPDKIGLENTKKYLRIAFNAWSKYSQLIFTEAEDYNADIVIDMKTGDHDDGYNFDGAGGVLAHGFMPGRIAGISGDVHFDEDENWKINPGEFENGIDFFSVAIHEIGHSLGLFHTKVQDSIMVPYYRKYNPDNFQLPYDDILAMHQVYVSKGFPESTGTFINDRDRPTTVGRPYFPPKIAPPSPTSTTRPRPTTTYRYKPNFEGDSETVPEHKEHDKTHGILPTVRPTTFHINDLETNRPPNICFEGDFDAVAHFRGEIFIFKNMYVWRLDRPGSILSGYPVTMERFFQRADGPSTRITAAYERPSDSSLVVFSGKQYWIYDGNGFIEPSPSSISNYGLPNYVNNIDAAMVFDYNHKTYLFSGDRYWRYDDFNKSMDPNYPKSINSFRNIPYPIDAAMTWSDDITYFFQGRRYWGFNYTRKETEYGYPKSATSYWLGCAS